MNRFPRRSVLAAATAFALVACGAANGAGPAAPAGASASGEPGHVLGSESAPITLIEYASPTCPACKYFHDTIKPVIQEKYISKGKVRFVFREYPINQVDVPAYVVARCAGPDRFFDVLDDLFANQEGIVQASQVGALGNALKTVAARHGIETDAAFDACMSDKSFREQLAAVYQTAEQYNVGGTPTFVLDGQVRNFEGDFRTPEGFSRQIDALLAAKGAQ